MNKSKKVKHLIIAPIIFVSIIFMSFIAIADNEVRQETTLEMNPLELPVSKSISVGWKTVDVYHRISGHYIIRYADLVSGVNPSHNMRWGCEYVDIDPSSGGWDCDVTTTYFSANGAEQCQYIHVFSNSTPTQGNNAMHTIDIRVRDEEGDESNWGGITLIIHYTPNPESSEPTNPCSNL
jgi:hypothetical protein